VIVTQEIGWGRSPKTREVTGMHDRTPGWMLWQMLVWGTRGVLAAIGGGLIALITMSALPAHAETIVVNVTQDTVAGTCPSTCTLRDALSRAASGDTIRIDVQGVIFLDTSPGMGTLRITKDTTIQGPGRDLLAVDGQDQVTVFEVASGVYASFSGLTIRNGNAQTAAGGGILNSGGTVKVTDSLLTGNRTVLMGGGIATLAGSMTVAKSILTNNFPHGIYSDSSGSVVSITDSMLEHNAYGGINANNTGHMRIERSSIVDDSSFNILLLTGQLEVYHSTLSGGLYGIIASDITGTLLIQSSTLTQHGVTALHVCQGNAEVVNSTISGNGGAALDLPPNACNGTVTVTYGTLVNNGAGVTGAPGRVSLRNSIVAMNKAVGNCAGVVISLGNNLSDTADCFPSNAGRGDIADKDPLLGPLTLNAPGLTKTHALRPGSPAIDAVTYVDSGRPNDCGGTVTADQRTMQRPQARQAPRCDIGAFELEAYALPTISPVGAQVTNEDTPTPAIAFKIDDAETPAASLTVTGASSDQRLVPNANVVLGGSGKDRTVTLTPAANESGSTEITLTVTAGGRIASTTFTLTVAPVNDAPVNSVPAAQTVKQTPSLAFSAATGNPIRVADVDAGTAPLQVALSALNGSLRLNGISGLTVGSGANGTGAVTVTGPLTDLNAALDGLTFTPTAGFVGAAALQITTSDLGNNGSGGPRAATDTVPITVPPFRSPPTISSIADQRIDVAGATLTVPFEVGSSTVPAASLVVTATSSNLAVVPASAIQLSGSGAARAIKVAAAGQAGTATITVAVSDGTASAQTTFQVTVAPAAVAPSTGPCAPRPAVRMTTAPDGGRLKVTLKAPPLDGQTNNRLIELRFGTFENGTVTIGGQPVDSRAPYLVPIPANTQGVELLVTRTTPGQPMMIPLTVVDECGAWSTFIGSGAGAGF
jgi:hypothetical protein